MQPVVVVRLPFRASAFLHLVVGVIATVVVLHSSTSASPLFGRSAAVDGQALYNASDDVISLNVTTFQPDIFHQEYGTLVEFYNAFCGFCQRFAPHWKRFATDVRRWRGIVQVAAVDCANDANSVLCREYEVMSYPSVRYFGPHFSDPKNYGTPMKHSDNGPEMRQRLAALLRNSTAPDGGAVPPAQHWPALGGEERSLADVFAAPLRWPERVQYAFVLYEPADSWIATEIALDFHGLRSIVVRRVQSAAVASTYGLLEPFSVAMVNRELEAVPLTLLKRQPFERDELQETLRRFLRQRGILDESVVVATPPVPAERNDSVSAAAAAAAPVDENSRVEQTIAFVRAHQPTVYWADLERAVWYSLRHEVPQFAEISGDRLEALKRYVHVLSR